MGPVRVVLDGRAFRELVAGREVNTAERFPDAVMFSERPHVCIVLGNVGWDVMRAAIDEAEAAQQVCEDPENS